ncbi:MOSC domain-containing protein [Pantanalinema sp. GBBB05]|uniref:MOSC domain-containing protein n=1 Tax=Pantanalinema sp. GBBB05 TaxID=2604139 RepID=UPI001DB42694|nr:MOSC domain-containing protein [Pantanalinema sp. GBBB05]
MPYLAQIFLYPIKSLDGVAVTQATILPSGALQHDREFAIVDQQGKVVNGKRTAAVHQIRASFDLVARTVDLNCEGTEQPTKFHLDHERSQLAAWLSDYFGFTVYLIQNTEMGFPDDTASPGPTLISTATLQTVTNWFPGLMLSNVRQRFRTNLEIADTAAFWEDQLFGRADIPVRFQIGEVQLDGINPCQRCIVPVRDPMTGQPMADFQKTFTQQRQATLPDWTEPTRFNHFYRLAVNTRLPAAEAGKDLHVDDQIHQSVGTLNFNPESGAGG